MSRIIALALLVPALAAPTWADKPVEIGVEEHLGKRLPLEELTFSDENGKPVVLKDLVDRPVLLTLVYFRCPGICTPLLQEVARVADLCDLEPGKDYRMITISFDPRETAELAKPKQANMIGLLKHKHVSPADWRFLTGDQENIRRITDLVGFRYAPDKNGDFLHPATVIFLSPDGMIARYLNGTEFNPADLKLAVIDASKGRARSFMQRISRLCYSYDPKGRGYVLQINRVILGVTLLFAGGFGAWLLLRRSIRRPAGADVTGRTS